jgi:hypothetical protein
MRNNIKLKIKKIPQKSSLCFHLDSPENNQDSNGGVVRVRGWVYMPFDEPVSIAIKRKNSVFLTERNTDRPDVKEFLKKRGEIVSENCVHGFDFEFMGGEGVSIGFCIDANNILWTHEISEVSHINFEEANSLEGLLNISEGVYNNFYFHNAKDWSKFIIFFNGALTGC